MAVREARPQPLAFPAAHMTAGHGGGGPSLVDEDEAFGFEIDWTVDQVPTLPQDVGMVLLDSVTSFFALDPVTDEKAMHGIDLDRRTMFNRPCLNRYQGVYPPARRSASE